MGEIEGTYRVLQTPGTRLGAQSPTGVSTLEPGQGLLAAMARNPTRAQEKHLQVRVKLLDGTVETFDIEPKCQGNLLLTQVWMRLNLVESDYFGLEFQNTPSCWIWLEPLKPIVRQVRRPKNTLLRLAVKFFPPDPGQLQEEYTRYLFALQLKRDLVEGQLTCSDTTAALLASHLLQSEIGDYDETLDREHLKVNEYLPDQALSLEKVLEFHRQHTGQTPAESDFQVLEIARKLDMYGVRFHVASDREGTEINLAVSHRGVLVFQGTTKINTFNWSKVRKLSFKRKRFLIKLHPEVHGPYQDTLEFLLGSRDGCKTFWKICVEYHTFFRLLDQPKPKAKAVLFSRGSSFRYSGRTQKQLVDYVKDSGIKKIPYERRHSKTRMSIRALTVDVPKQSASFTEGIRTPVSPSSAHAAFYSLPGSPTAGLLGSKDSSCFLTAPQSVATDRNSGASATSPNTTWPPGPPGPQAGPGAGFSHPSGLLGAGSRTSDPDVGKAGREGPAGAQERGEGGLSNGECWPGRVGRRGPPLFTLTNPQLQVSEEFIDDDPAEISFFAGGSEAFSCPYGSLVLQDAQGPSLLPGTPSRCGTGLGSLQASPDRYSTEAVDMDVDDDESEFEEEGGCLSSMRPSDTCELFEVKAQASLMQSLLSASSETSSLRNNRSESSSLSNVPLASGLAGQSGASSLVNFPACSVRSECSSAFQFSDILDQLEQLSYPPTATEASSGSDTDSWDSEAEAPLDASLFFSNPFAQAPGERLPLDLQNHLNAMAWDEHVDKPPH